MHAKVRIDEVAQLAGVSTATVSRALSHPDRVRPQTRDLVQSAVDKLGYVPDAAGRALASGRTRTVGYVIPTLDHAIFARSTQALQIALAREGYQLLVASHNYDPIQEISLVEALQQRGVDALVLVGAEHHKSLWQSILNWRKPVLLTWSCDPRLPSVGFDNHAIGVLATQHLLDLGHRRIAMISGQIEHNDRAYARVMGLRDTLDKVGAKLPADAISYQPLTIRGGRLGLLELLKSNNPPSAIVCGNDLLAAGALLEAQSQNIRVPHDLSICGIDNHDLSAEISPGLTTVNLPTQDLGKIAAMQVLAALSGLPIAQQSLLPFELLIRGTTAHPSKKFTKYQT